ncbi:probable ATP-dependent RNA helicase DDX56 isoform X2 [Xenia sp. Carnegie-2017]|uniref:probable ATP-dependent RNA helicase DDX56 isoform X2 n=1 Tax=Xenia sp. Carnegie-2017 TaxID=2897299 RepID=UPI001F03D9A9|nr:probable ATP-dependent RNA helicase DDX56 isoform X2 [Xenia sp. Carnegie-2017]
MAEQGNVKQFHEFGLDDRLLKAIAKLKWARPTRIQEVAIPLALEGKDLLARANTGSGKTAVYAISIIQKILRDKKEDGNVLGVKALILVPTKELSQQASKNIKDLTSYCSRDVRVVDVAQNSLDVMRPLLLEKPDVLVGTPSRILGHLQALNLNLKESLNMLVFDEADLLFSYGYEKEIKTLTSYLPKIYQACLMSATLSEEVSELKKLVLHNPVIVKLDSTDASQNGGLNQYLIKCETDDKFLLIYALLKLKLVLGKTLIFVNGIDRCYRLKLFLEQFSIKSCVLNSELPHNSRCHIVEEFNKGIYDYIIAADESAERSKSSCRSATGQPKDKEFGVSRGIDFQDVENVVNFDFPKTVENYIHRVGRTARGFNTGNALSLVTSSDEKVITAVEERLSPNSVSSADEKLFTPFKFKMDEIEGFRYRSQDALRAVTKASIREARLKEIKTEILNSEKLKAFFEDNPRDLQLLRHDKVLHPTKIQPHLRHIPDYLVPETMKPSLNKSSERRKRSFVTFHKNRRSSNFKKQKVDPLRTFKASHNQKPNDNKKRRKKKR